MRNVFLAVWLLVAILPAAHAQDWIDSILSTSCSDLSGRGAEDCQEMVAYLNQIHDEHMSSPYRGHPRYPRPLVGSSERECIVAVESEVITEQILRDCVWMAYSARVKLGPQREWFEGGYPGLGGVIATSINCDTFIRGLIHLTEDSDKHVWVKLKTNAQNCRTIASVARSWGGEPIWANCALGTDYMQAYFQCLVPFDKEYFDTAWGEIVHRCKEGRDAEGAYGVIMRVSQLSGRIVPENRIDCSYVYSVAVAGGLLTEQEAVSAKVETEVNRADLEEIDAKIAEGQRLQAERDAIEFSDTYGKLFAPGQPAHLLRNLETARDSIAVSGGNALFTSGLVDVLMGKCPVNISAAHRAILADFVVRGVMDGQNSFGGSNLDDIASAVRRSMDIVRAGQSAAMRLECAEPVSTKLLLNVVKLLGYR